MKRSSLINVTPLLDVLLVLVVVLLAATGLPLRSLPVQPPRVGPGFAVVSEQSLVLALDARGQLSTVDGKVLSDLSVVQGKTVELAAAAETTYEVITATVDRLAVHKPQEIRLAGRG